MFATGTGRPSNETPRTRIVTGAPPAAVAEGPRRTSCGVRAAVPARPLACAGMPTEDFLTGCVLFALMLLGGRSRRRRSSCSAGSRTSTASSARSRRSSSAPPCSSPSTSCRCCSAILNRATVLAATLLAVALATRVTRPGRPARPRTAARRRRRAAASTGRSPGIAAAIALVAFVADLGRWAGDELVGVDPLTFHLPNIGRWIQTGLAVADRPVRAAARPRQLPEQRRRRAAEHGPAVAQRLPRPRADLLLPRRRGRRGLRRRARAARAGRGVGPRRRRPSSRSRSSASRRSRAPCPTRCCGRRYACGVLFLLRHARTSRRSDLAPRRHRARDRLRDEVVRHQLGRASLVVVWAARAARCAASRGALRAGRCSSAGSRCSATPPGSRATSSSPATRSSP